MKESNFQSKLIKEIESMFGGKENCLILKNDPNYKQGIPDLLILYNDKWAALEVKVNDKAKHQPNQDHYISKMNDWSFASFISPENKEEVLHGMEQALRT